MQRQEHLAERALRDGVSKLRVSNYCRCKQFSNKRTPGAARLSSAALAALLYKKKRDKFTACSPLLYCCVIVRSRLDSRLLRAVPWQPEVGTTGKLWLMGRTRACRTLQKKSPTHMTCFERFKPPRLRLLLYTKSILSHQAATSVCGVIATAFVQTCTAVLPCSKKCNSVGLDREILQ